MMNISPQQIRFMENVVCVCVCMAAILLILFLIVCRMSFHMGDMNVLSVEELRQAHIESAELEAQASE